MSFLTFLIVVLSAYTALYFAAYYLVPIFFTQKAAALGIRTLWSVVVVTMFTGVILIASASITDAEWGNRLQHALGGGFMAFITYLLAVKDNRVHMTPLQVFVLGVLLVTALGVANELMEFLVQSYTSIVFATHINDTWLDLLSNSIGILLASITLPFFLSRDVEIRELTKAQKAGFTKSESCNNNL